jgi:hypothetical protein
MTEIPEINFSKLKYLQYGSDVFYYRLQTPEPLSDAMRIGKAFHMYVLEPKRFNDEYVILETLPGEKTRIFLELYAKCHDIITAKRISNHSYSAKRLEKMLRENQAGCKDYLYFLEDRSKQLLLRAEFDMIQGMSEKIKSDAIYNQLKACFHLETLNIQHEVTLRGKHIIELPDILQGLDLPTSIPLKGTLDVLINDAYIVELKTINELYGMPALYDYIEKSQYLEQLQFYWYLLQQNTAALTPISERKAAGSSGLFLHVSVKKAPYPSFVFESVSEDVYKSRIFALLESYYYLMLSKTDFEKPEVNRFIHSKLNTFIRK